MSVFSDTQGTPERVYALMRLIEAAGPSLPRKVAADLFDPKVALGWIAEEGRSDFVQTLSAAESLGLIEETNGALTIVGGAAPPTYLDFGDIVHAHLVTASPDNPNGTVLDAFSLFVERLEAEGNGQWLATVSNNALADQIRSLLASKRSEAGTFNPTRVAPLAKWTSAIGLMTEVTDRQKPIADLSRRLVRELRSVPREAREAGMPSSAFVTWILERMPYLPGGSRFASLFGDVGIAGAGRLPIVLSAALRDLHDDGIIRLEALGDSGGSARLAEDRFHALEAFDNVRMLSVEAAG